MKHLKRISLITGIVLLLLIMAFLSQNLFVQAVSDSILYGNRNDVLELYIDSGTAVGEMKPLHGINNGPKSGYELAEDGTSQWKLDATALYQQAGIPIVRTHDTEYPYGQDLFVDIHCIFPDFSRDPEDPSAYHFEETDQYIAAIAESGAEILFRLGESIDHSGDNLYINPPEDNQKWAQICEHIVRHYNEGWADGFYDQIQYWEIWNEPHNAPMWTGTTEEYCELYCVTASYLKETHPDIMVGGPALSLTEFILPFLEFVNSYDDGNVPLDFLSWHLYTDNPAFFGVTADQIREVLDFYGYQDTLIFMDEWNYVIDWNSLHEEWENIHSERGASFDAAALITMQYSSIDSAMYYDGQYVFADSWCGLYDAQAKPEAGYYAFYYFNQLYQLQTQVAAQRLDDLNEALYVCAASNQDRTGVLLTNYKPNDEPQENMIVKFSFSSPASKARITVINDHSPNGRTYEKEILSGNVYLKIAPNDVVYIEPVNE